MAKKKNNNRERQERGGSLADQARMFGRNLGYEISDAPVEKKEENPFQNYDPAEDQRDQRGGGSQRVAYEPDLSRAPHSPYNFVPIAPKVYGNVKQVAHNAVEPDRLYTGAISYQMTAETPMMVDGGRGEFYRNKDGVYALPGSTVRGLVRSNAMTLGYADFHGEIDDYYLMYRAVAGGCLSGRYKELLGARIIKEGDVQYSVLDHVKAGYIKCEGKDYYYYRNMGDTQGKFGKDQMNYYVANERIVMRDRKEEFGYLMGEDGGQYRFQNLNEPQDQPFERVERRGRVSYVGTQNPNYAPYYEKITYKTNGKYVVGIRKEGFSQTGYVMSTGVMQQKKAFYVIPEPDLSERMRIPVESVEAFKIDYNRKENGIPKKQRPFFSLPKDGEIRPIFYIELGGRFYFGYTPRLRLMYDHTVAEGIGRGNDQDDPSKEGSLDYARSMFGYATDDSSYKSKVSFTDARLVNDKVCRPEDKRRLVLAEPKPTSYLEYLQQTEGKPPKTYNDVDFRLRGVKQYWLQKNTHEGMDVRNDKIKSEIAPIQSGSTFAGEIRFHNLTKAELGLLVWSIRLEEDSQMNVGKAKAYGYGRVRVEDVTLKLQDVRKAYQPTLSALSSDPFRQVDREERDSFVEYYQEQLAAWLGRKGNERTALEYVMSQSSIKDFFFMKSFIVEDERTAAYMRLEEFSGYKQRNVPLPTVRQIVSED